MTMQIPDTLIWKKKEYKFVGADNIYQLFDPKKFGFNPKFINTACWKGFLICLIVNENDELILDRLEKHDSNDNYPQINGVESYIDDYGCNVYKNINLLLNNYSGTIIIADDLKKSCIGRAFIGPHCYNKTYELEVKNGKVVEYKDTSGTYEGF